MSTLAIVLISLAAGYLVGRFSGPVYINTGGWQDCGKKEEKP